MALFQGALNKIVQIMCVCVCLIQVCLLFELIVITFSRKISWKRLERLPNRRNSKDNYRTRKCKLSSNEVLNALHCVRVSFIMPHHFKHCRRSFDIKFTLTASALYDVVQQWMIQSAFIASNCLQQFNCYCLWMACTDSMVVIGMIWLPPMFRRWI